MTGSGQPAYTPDHYPHAYEPDASVLVRMVRNGRDVAVSSAMGWAIDMPITSIREMPLHGPRRSGAAASVAHGRIRDMPGL